MKNTDVFSLVRRVNYISRVGYLNLSTVHAIHIADVTLRALTGEISAPDYYHTPEYFESDKRRIGLDLYDLRPIGGEDVVDLIIQLAVKSEKITRYHVIRFYRTQAMFDAHYNRPSHWPTTEVAKLAFDHEKEILEYA